ALSLNIVATPSLVGNFIIPWVVDETAPRAHILDLPNILSFWEGDLTTKKFIHIADCAATIHVHPMDDVPSYLSANDYRVVFNVYIYERGKRDVHSGKGVHPSPEMDVLSLIMDHKDGSSFILEGWVGFLYCL
ncbi:hypothetical protein Tco_0135944, partial [Tanacetum coccineum]